MKERPILFNGDMVRAILRGQKTQTRRPITPPFEVHRQGSLVTLTRPDRHGDRFCPYPCPFGQPGDRLWVRETFAEIGSPSRVIYRADDKMPPEGTVVRWAPSIHMPRALSRITLEITDISARHVQDISEEDAWAEGTESLENNWIAADLCATTKRYDLCVEEARCTYAHLWDTLYAARGLGWDANPWVWVVSFKRLEEH